MMRYSNEKVDIDKYTERIRHNGFVLFNKDKFLKRAEELKIDLGVYQLMALDVMMQKSSCTIANLSKGGVLAYLKNHERCPEHFFKKKGVQSESLDMKKCLEPLYKKGFAQEFLKYYMKMRSLKSVSNDMLKLAGEIDSEQYACNSYGEPLYVLPYNVDCTTNLRFNYNNYDIITQIPKNSADCMSVEDGYLLAWGDFAQSDFRIAYNIFLRSPENDAVMLKYEDKYEALARIVHKHLGISFDLAEFAEDRSLYKKLVLATMYGTRDSNVPEEAEFIKTFTKFLEKCPKYKKYYETLISLHRLGLPINVTSYFGYEQLSPVKYSTAATIYRALNCPIQTATSEIVIITVNKILDIFYSLGYTEDDISLYCVRHDEPIFKMRKSVMKDSWVFERFSELLVDDWSPLALDFEFGYNYKQRDEELQELFNSSIEDNKHLSTPMAKDIKLEHRSYFPVQEVLHFQVYSMIVEDVTVITYYCVSTNEVYYSIAETNDREQISLAVKQQFHNLKTEKQFRGIIVNNDFEDSDDYGVGEMYIRYFKQPINDLVKAANLCKYAVCIYCKNNGIESPTDPPLENFSDFINSVGKLKMMEMGD